MGEEREDSNRIASYVGSQDSNFLQYRLNTDPLIQQVEVALSGKIVNYMVNPQTGEVLEQIKVLSQPKTNTEGFTAIINYVRAHVNNQTVQGNMDTDEYNNFIADVREDFSMILMINMYKWDIKNSDYEYIVDTILDVIKLFLSRIKGNKERESYNKMVEQTSTSRAQKGWGLN